MPDPVTLDRFKNRRRLAWLSFALLAGFMVTMCARLAVGDDPNSWTGLGGVVITMLTTVVLGYQGSVAYEKKVDAAVVPNQ